MWNFKISLQGLFKGKGFKIDNEMLEDALPESMYIPARRLPTQDTVALTSILTRQLRKKRSYFYEQMYPLINMHASKTTMSIALTNILTQFQTSWFYEPVSLSVRLYGSK